MLAAECAWAILRAEHARTRELLARLNTAMKTEEDEACVRRRATTALRVIERLEAFEEATHRPKGVVMLDILRGRSSEADELLDQLGSESEHCSGLLSQAKLVLKLAEAGDMNAAAKAEALLQQHRQIMYAHLDKEDTLLHSQTALLLTAEEWAAVVSSISKEVRAAKERERRRPQQQPHRQVSKLAS
ncbi:hemerythrin domain-containing protein [Variovorax sp. AFSI2.2]|uniref:hemerythrin domain-containing protein n=1 Tax=Variovorax sp. AFSI2.2 TaxID=3384160 RepID=UPI003EB8CC61